jgi:hypothetical protein
MLTRDCLPICVLVIDLTEHAEKQSEDRVRHTRKQHQFGYPLEVISWEIPRTFHDIHIGQSEGEPVVRGRSSQLLRNRGRGEAAQSMQTAARVRGGSRGATYDFTHDEVSELDANYSRVNEAGQRMMGFVEDELLSAVRGEG